MVGGLFVPVQGLAKCISTVWRQALSVKGVIVE
jgi:hypothetical protein